MSDPTDGPGPEQEITRLEKVVAGLHRRLERTRLQLENYEGIVDRTQHLLNTRIEEVEAARSALAARTRELELSERRFRQLADAAFETIIIHADGKIVDCNDAAVDLYGIAKQELIGRCIEDLVDPRQAGGAAGSLRRTTNEPVEAQLRRGEELIPVELRSREIVLQGSSALVTVLRDISAHKRMQAYLENVANSDPLTGVGNRRFFLAEGNRECARARRERQPLSLLMLDIDKFKQINDTYGHDAGDLALCAMSDACIEALRESDLFARLGGEEFAAILPDTPLDGALVLAERLRLHIASQVTDTPRGSIRFTISIGVTQNIAEEGAHDDIEAMLGRADRSLYRAKESGRNRVETG